MVKQEKIKTGKTTFYELLKTEPKYSDGGECPDNEDFPDIREKWENEVKEAFYEEVLQIYEEDEQFREQISDLKDEVKELKKLLKTHVHNGEKVYAEVD